MFLKSLWLTALTAASLFMVACEDTPTDPELVAPNAPTAIMATSRSATAISVKWTAATTGEAATGYVLVVAEDGGANAQELTISSATTTNVDVTSLTEGKVYQMYVMAVNDTVRSTASPTIKWAPAQRHTANLRIYETDSDQGSGIELPSTAGLTISEGGRWDICLDTRDGSYDIASPTLSSYTSDEANPKFPNGDLARVTGFGKLWQNVASLDQVYEAVALNDAQNGPIEPKLLNFNTADTKGESFAFVVKTAAGNFAKVFVKSTGGRLLQGTAPNRYLELEVSFQSGVGIPYAIVAPSETSPYSKKSGNMIESNIKKND
jgi:hypothetical protein